MSRTRTSTRLVAALLGVALGAAIALSVAAQSPTRTTPARPFVEQPTGAQTVLIAPGACIVPDTTLPFPGGWIGADSVRRPCPVILYNPRWFSERGFSDAIAVFVVLHEYGHMLLQHRPYHEISSDSAKVQERQADCFAATHVARRWPEVIPVVVRFWLDVPEHQPEEVDHDQPRARAKLIVECANAARTP